jgi:hypothetical protein
LKGSKKKEFDPFCRGKIITLEYESPPPQVATTHEAQKLSFEAQKLSFEAQKLSFETALCQLKFFRWAIENLVLDYIEKHYNNIYEDMRQFSSKSLPGRETDVRKKKTELSKSIFQQMCVSHQNVVLDFRHNRLIEVA